MPSQSERAEAQRQAKLTEIERQVADGTLTIRTMTDEERRQNPPRPRPPKRQYGRGGDGGAD